MLYHNDDDDDKDTPSRLDATVLLLIICICIGIGIGIGIGINGINGIAIGIIIGIINQHKTNDSDHLSRPSNLFLSLYMSFRSCSCSSFSSSSSSFDRNELCRSGSFPLALSF